MRAFDDEYNKTAMVMTQDEWDALSQICRLFLAATEDSPHLVNIDARQEIAQRIVDACE